MIIAAKLSYCLKNYYIKRANQVADGKYVSQWYHEHELKHVDCKNLKQLDLENKLDTIKRIANYG